MSVPKNAILGCRFEEKEAQLLRSVCKARGEDVSDFIRRSVRVQLAELGYMNEEEEKALGLERPA